MQALLHVGKMLASTILICAEVKHMVHGPVSRERMGRGRVGTYVATVLGASET
jgi:hypothetical protein